MKPRRLKKTRTGHNYIPAIELFMDGMKALSDIECNGMLIDEEAINQGIHQLTIDIERLDKELYEFEEGKLWYKKYGKTLNWESSTQIKTILFDEFKYNSKKKTASGQNSIDEDSLQSIGVPFTRKLIEKKKCQKARDTYLKGIQREIAYGKIHPSFNLNTTVTYRSSSNSPNFQNMPIRDPHFGRLIRECISAPKGMGIMELDYSGLEVSTAYCYHQDPQMFIYLTDKTTNMHRDVAMDCFMLTKEQMTKDIRWAGKSGFTFAQQYGDFWGNCAPSLWEYALELELPDGTPLIEHLKSKGITGLGTLDSKGNPSAGSFYAHIKKVEDIFWNDRFAVYGKWKIDNFAEYCDKGYIVSKTGFIYKGAISKNQSGNYGPQGSGFHLLLWTIIKVNQWLKRNKMKSYIIGQVHDSIIMYYHPSEIKEVILKVKEIGEKDVTEHWKWINVPLTIDADVAPVGKSWYDKQECGVDTIFEENEKWYFLNKKKEKILIG